MEQQEILHLEDFKELRLRNGFYVDKTKLIQTWWERGAAVTCVTRPRRFGKTLNLSMLDCFFSRRFKDDGEMLFGDMGGRRKLYIWDQTVKSNLPGDERIPYRDIQGTFPVIFLSFNGVRGDSYDSILNNLMNEVLIAYYQYFPALIKSSALSEDEKYGLCELNDGLQGKSVRFSREDVLQNSLRRLIYCIHREEHKKPLLFLDEYDVPLEYAYLNGFYTRAKQLLDALFANTFKGNPDLGRAFLTGVTNLCASSAGSGANNPDIFTVLSDRYGEFFGFTEEETVSALEEYSVSDAMPSLRKWYDGYTFGYADHLYNPLSVSSFLSSCVDRRKVGVAFSAGNLMKPYWVNTSSNDLVRFLFQSSMPSLKQGLTDLLAGKAVRASVWENLTFRDLDNSEDAAWNMMLTYGYLTPSGPIETTPDYEEIMTLALPNREVRLVLSKMVRSWFLPAGVSWKNFLTALTDGNLENMTAYLTDILEKTASTFDRGGNSDPENFYHGLVLGMSLSLDGRFVLESNRESGLGRYDISLEPGSAVDPAIVIEFKVFDPKKEKSLSDTVRRALRQIHERKYDTAFLHRGIPQARIHHYGFAFRGKEVLIGDDTTHPLSPVENAGTQGV